MHDLDLRPLLEHLPAGVLVYARDIDIAFANREACEVLGLTCDLRTGTIQRDPDLELVDEDLVALAPEDHPARRIAARRASLPKEIIGIRSRSSGRTKWILVEGHPEFDGDRIRHISICFVDVTERRRAESALREGRYFFRESQKATSLGSYSLDLASGVWKGSEELDTVFGIDAAYPHDLEGWLRLIHPDDAAAMHHYFVADVVGKGDRFHRDYRIVRIADGCVR